MWEIEVTDQFRDWYDELDDSTERRVGAAIEELAHFGPGLGHYLVDTIKGSRHTHMKELRPPGGFVRVLFAFDPRRAAILLIGGDKRKR